MFPAGTRLGVKLRTGNYRLAQERFHYAILPSTPLLFERDLSHLFWGQRRLTEDNEGNEKAKVVSGLCFLGFLL
jgi:hypothetical protein